MTYFCITINAHPHSGWFCVKHYLISLKRNSIALHGLKPHNQTKKAAIRQPFCKVWVLNKPSSVPRSGDDHLSSLTVTCKLKRHNPEGSAGSFIPPLFGLAPDGVYLASLLPDRWCALTAPFHPYLQMQAVHISVALSLRSPSPDVIRHPALWSSDFPHLA